MDYHFTLRTIYPYLGDLVPALWQTLLISSIAIVGSLAIGVIGAVSRSSRFPLARIAAGLYVEVLRNIPLLVFMYLVYFVAPSAGLQLSSFSSALIALTLNSGAYMTEILRGGLAVVPKGQFEAAHSQGMTVWQTLRHVVLPQVLRTVYAPLGNQFIRVVLGSSLASVVGVEEVSSWMQTAGSSSYRFFESFAVATVVYLILCQIINVIRIQAGRHFFKAGH